MTKMNPCEKVRLGNTSVHVTRLALGGGALGGLYSDVTEEQASGTVRRALERGLNFFDTAPLYGHGKGELRLGHALAGVRRESFALATKVGRVLVPEDPAKVTSVWFENPAPYRPEFDFGYDSVMRSFEESLKRLGVERIEVVHIHDPDDYYEQALRETFPTLEKLRSQGLLDAIGAGMTQVEMLTRFAREAAFDCFLLASRYTLIDHAGLTELLPLCAEKRIIIIIGGPYSTGIVATGARPGAKFDYKDAPPALLEKVGHIEAVCKRHGVPLKAAALQFPLAHPAVACAIPGCRSAEEADDSFRMMSHAIPSDFWQELKAEKLLPNEAPVPA